MPRKARTPLCACRCGMSTKGGKFRPGHDAKLISALIEAVGGLDDLRALVEERVGKEIVPTVDPAP